jgi:ribosome recycling factor
MADMNINSLIKDTRKLMDNALDALRENLKSIRTGKASPSLVENIQVDYYGSNMRLRDLANITAPEARMLVVQPWDKNAVAPIEKAIMAANLGLTPSNEGTIIRLPIPELSEERRKEMTKLVKERGEEARIEIRNIRRKANDLAKKATKDSEITEDDQKHLQNEVQKLTDESIKEIDTEVDAKSEELMNL